MFKSLQVHQYPQTRALPVVTSILHFSCSDIRMQCGVDHREEREREMEMT